MATPMTAAQWLKALRDEGVTDIVEMPGWRTHNRNHKGPFQNVHATMIHHTAGEGAGLPGILFNGTGDLPGPLCHDYLTRTGRLYLVGNGRTNHAGTVARNAYNAVLNEETEHPRPDAAEPIDGNAVSYGLECENSGAPDRSWPAVQYDKAVRIQAARCRFHGWSANSVWAHKEATRRKPVDPRLPMDSFRAKVAERLRHPASWNPGDKAPAPKPVPTPPQEASPARMDYTQMTRSTDLVIPAGQGRPVLFDIEHADDPNDHGDGGRTILDGGQYTGTVWVWLPATVDVEHIGVKMVHELAGGVSTHSTGHVQTQDVPSTAAVSVTGHVPADRKLFVELYNYSATPITVSRVDIRLLSQAI